MSSWDQFDDELIEIMGLTYTLIKKVNLTRKRNRPKKYWVNAYLAARHSKGRFSKDFEDMRNNPAVFKENFHILPGQFDTLFDLLESGLRAKSRSRPTDYISPKEKLAITLEFLASGSLQRHIACTYRVSKQRIGPIIEGTCREIFTALQPTHLKVLSKVEWTSVANRFHGLWNFPNCLGAIDGKHVAIKCPKNAATCFYNYKGFHSIVLMAVADADYRFLYADIGSYGSEGDSTVFRNCDFGKGMLENKLKIPSPMTVGGKIIPHLFLADDAFPLHVQIMKPYKPTRKNELLSKEDRIFNYRLSRARRCVENAFGILCARWIVLARTMFVSPDRAQHIVGACVMLHNFLIKESKDDYCPPGFSDNYDGDGNLVEGTWRNIIPDNSMFHSNVSQQVSGRPPTQAITIRDHLRSYFNYPVGSLHFQNKSIFLE